MKYGLSKAGTVALCLCSCMRAAWAQPAPASFDGQAASVQGPTKGEATEYGGIVTSQVLTSLGHYFHSKFTEGWDTFPDAQSYVLLVRELYSPRFGTEIRVLYNERIVFRSVLPRSLVAVADIGRSAAETVHNNVIEIGLQSLLFSDPDAAKSDF